MEDKKIKEIKDTMCYVGKYAYDATSEFVESAKLTLAIEKQKSRLAKVYEEIGEKIVSGISSTADGKEALYRLIDEAKHEKAKLRLLYEKKRNNSYSPCPYCGKYSKKNTICNDCGEFVK